MIMKARGNETGQMRNVLAIGVWENEGGASGRDFPDEEHGRRTEADRSRTVRQIAAGVPAHADGQAMAGLTPSARLAQSKKKDCLS